MRAQHAVRLRRRLGGEKILDAAHRRDEPRAVALGEPRQHRRDLVAGAGVDRGEGGAALERERDQALAGVVRRRLAHDQAGVREAAQDAAEIAGVEPELLAELRRRDPVPLRELVDDARLSQ